MSVLTNVHIGVVCVQYWPLFALLTQFVWTVFVYSSEILATAAHFIAAAIVICGGSVVVWHVQGMHFLSYYACRKIISKVCKNVSTLHGIILSF